MALGVGPGFDWNNFYNNGGSTTPQPGSHNWNQQMQARIQQATSQIPVPQAPQAQPAPNFQQSLGGIAGLPNAPQAAGGPAGEDPRLTSILAQLKAQAALSDSALNDQAAQGIAAQRSQMQRQLEKSLTGTLSSRGLLRSGANAAKIRQELETPMQEQLAAQQERIRQDLVSRRDATSNNLTAQLNDLQRQKSAGESDRARLQIEQQRAEQALGLDRQRMANDQQRFQWEAQNAAQQNAYQQSMMQYQMQKDAMQQQIMQQAQQSGYNGGTGYNAPRGGGSMTGSMTGNPNDTSWFDIRPGSTADIGGSREREAARIRAVDQAQSQSRPGNAFQSAMGSAMSAVNGNGMSSAGSSAGFSMNGPMVGNIQIPQPQGGGGGGGGYGSGGGGYGYASQGAAGYAGGAAAAANRWY